MSTTLALTALLKTAQAASPIAADWWQRPVLRLDLSAGNPRLQGLDPADPVAFGAWIEAEQQRVQAQWSLGGYAEDRVVYGMSPLFAGAGEARSVHLGLDLWLPAGSPVHAVLDGSVHSLADNARFGDYGPTVILMHELAGERFYSLYGHLARRSLEGLQAGQTLRAGERLGWLGCAEENLGWPPHLHFQLIKDMGDDRGDYPGVCPAAQQAEWLDRCPDPAALLHPWFRQTGLV